MKKINLNFADGFAYTLIAFVVFILITMGVFAFGTSNPSTFGHSAKELDLSTGIDGDVVFNGNLNVMGKVVFGGWLKIGTTTVGCSSSNEGTLRYNSTGKMIEVCDKINWKPFSVPCKSGNMSFITPGYYQLNITNSCKYTFTVNGAGGGNGGPGGGVKINNYIPSNKGILYMLVGGKGTQGTSGGGYGGGGNGAYTGSGKGDGYGGGGASTIRFESILLAISGGGAGGGTGGGPNPASSSASGGGGNDCGQASGARTLASGMGGCNNVGGFGAETGGSNGNYNILFMVSTGGNAQTGNGGDRGGNGGGGSGYGGGGGAYSYQGIGGGGGGGFLNTSIISSYTVVSGAPRGTDGSVIISWVSK